MSFPVSDYAATLPLLWTMVLSLIVLVIEFVMKDGERTAFWTSIVGLLVALGLSAYVYPTNGNAFLEMLRTGPFANFFNAVFLVSAGITIILSRTYLRKENANNGEFYCLVLMAVVGMMFIASAANFIMVFLGIELMSICLYVLAGYMRRRVKSNESALKYFLLGAFATGFLTYGIALVYGASGTADINRVVSQFATLSSSYLFWGGIGLILVGLAFKAAAVPFHMWVPDVYEGAPTTATAFMATGAKAAALAAFLVVFGQIVWQSPRVSTTLAVIAAASMILGNVIAISQTNLKRMLAYSSIAHGGYMLTGLAAGNELGQQGIMFYLAVYAMMNLGAFGILSIMEREEERNLSYDDYSGFSARNPFLAAMMAVFMFSLAGIPPFGGFFAKYFVFAAAVNADLTWLAIVGVLTSLVSVYYYLRLVVVMYFGMPARASAEPVPSLSIVALALSAFVTILSGVLPSSVLALIHQAF